MASKEIDHERRKFTRETFRFTCELSRGGERHSGIGTNLSASGLFIQTSAPFAPGDVVHVRARGAAGEEIELDAVVVRKTKHSRGATPVTDARPGIGLDVTFASDAYYRLLEILASA